jgi:hypothetical protein
VNSAALNVELGRITEEPMETATPSVAANQQLVAEGSFFGDEPRKKPGPSSRVASLNAGPAADLAAQAEVNPVVPLQGAELAAQAEATLAAPLQGADLAAQEDVTPVAPLHGAGLAA